MSSNDFLVEIKQFGFENLHYWPSISRYAYWLDPNYLIMVMPIIKCIDIQFL